MGDLDSSNFTHPASVKIRRRRRRRNTKRCRSRSRDEENVTATVPLTPSSVRDFVVTAAPARLLAARCRSDVSTVAAQLDAAVAMLRESGDQGDLLRRACQLLALTLCQEGRTQVADPLLRDLGFAMRLAQPILNYHAKPISSCKLTGMSDDSEPYVIAVDDGLPLSTLMALQTVFGPDSCFWKEHGYNIVAANL